jgi:hypothetical protein
MFFQRCNFPPRLGKEQRRETGDRGQRTKERGRETMNRSRETECSGGEEGLYCRDVRQGTEDGR